MSKNTQYKINPKLINILSKMNVRPYFDNLPTAFKASYHKIAKPELLVQPEGQHDISIQEVSSNLKSILILDKYDINDFYYIYEISYFAQQQLASVANYKNPNINYRKKHETIDVIKIFRNQVQKIFEEVKKEYEILFYKAVNPIISKICLTKECSYYSLEGNSKKQIMMKIKRYKPKSKRLNKGKLNRTIYPVVELFSDDPKQIILKKGVIDNAIPLPIYIQSHALHRLATRIGPEFNQYLYENLIISCRKQNFAYQNKFSYMMEFYIDSAKLGYFTVTVEKNIALIRSFKFITMIGTPEYEKLRKFIPTGSQIWQYLNLDSYETIIESDIKSNKELYDIFQKCDLAHLFEFAKGDSIAIADVIAPYIKSLDK